MNRTDFAVHPSEIDLAEVADDAVRRYQPQAEAFGVSLAALSEGPAPAIADADRVLQVVSNLVENALRLTPRGGEVRVVGDAGAAAGRGHRARARPRRTASMRSSASISTPGTGASGRSAPGSASRSSRS